MSSINILKIFFVLSLLTIMGGCEDGCEKIFKSGFKGIVTKKEWTPSNHDARYIYIKSSEKEFVMGVDPIDKEFYDFVAFGDSILKAESTKLMVIKRNNKSYNYTFQCGF
jgi:hypothetical protein